MCDHDAYVVLRKRVTDLEISAARFEEQVKTLFVACADLKSAAQILRTLIIAIVVIAMLAILALIYGAVGSRGFNAVTTAAKTVSATVTPAGSALAAPAAPVSLAAMVGAAVPCGPPNDNGRGRSPLRPAKQDLKPTERTPQP